MEEETRDTNEEEMSDEEFQKLAREVGKASYSAIKEAEKHIIKGSGLLKAAEEAEKFLSDIGFGKAFPINISIGSNAAHYTPTLGDNSIFPDKGLVKVDFGASKEGVLGDCALTVDLSGDYGALSDASKEALDNAISLVKAGAKVREIGKEIATTIEKKGFKPIKNLGGHGVGIHELHDEPFIPNYDNGDETELEENTIIAIEPFATMPNGRGLVSNGDIKEIFSFIGDVAQPRMPNSRNLLSLIRKDFSMEPFAARWLSSVVSNRFELYSGLSELERLGIIESHPVLVELGGTQVAQFEASLLVTKDGCEILTK
ncbi:MAG: type II methionyl aminopeptidase [Methanothrix sp.]